MEENIKRNQLREARQKLDRTRKNLQKIEKEKKQILRSKIEMSKEEIKEEKTMGNRLAFGLKFWSTYKKHDSQDVHGIFWNPNSRAFVSWNEKYIHVWNPQTDQQIYHTDFHQETKSHAITTLSYSKTNHLYIVISSDFKAHFFNESLILIKQLPFGNRLIQQSKYIDSTNTLIASGVEGVFLYKLHYTGATDKKQVHKLDPLGIRLHIKLVLYKRLDGVSEWVKGMQVDREHDILFAWSHTETSVYTLSTGEPTFTLKGLFNAQEDVITDVLYMPKYRYIVICSKQARLIVYKWSETEQIVTEFKGMDHIIKGMVRHPSRINQFITFSLDQTVRVWCLEKFSCQYKLIIPFEIKGLYVLDNLQFACMQRKQIQIGKVLDLVFMMHKSQTNVVCSGQCFIDMERRKENWPYAIFSQFRDNSIKLLAPKPMADVKIKSTIYPPPNADSIIQVCFSSILKQVIVLVRSGVIYFYRLEQGTSIMVKQIKSSKLRDSDQQLFDQQLTMIEVGCIEPPFYDCQKPINLYGNDLKHQDTWYEENFEDEEKKKKISKPKKNDVSSETSLLETDSEERERIPEDRFMIMGFHRGQIIIYNIFSFDIPICRFEVSRNKILMIREVLPHKQYLVYDETYSLSLCRLSKSGVEYLHQVNMFRPLFTLVVQDTFVYAAFQQGDIEFMEVRNLKDDLIQQKLDRRASSQMPNSLSEEQLKSLKTSQIKGTTFAMIRYDFNKNFDHEDPLTAITISQSSGYIASADSTGLIKIWNRFKQLIREIQFPCEILSLTFIDHRGDLMIGHQEIQSLLKAQVYMANSSSVRNYDTDDILMLAQEVNNDRMYNMYLKESGMSTEQEKSKVQEKMFGDNNQFAENSASDQEELYGDLDNTQQDKHVQEKVRSIAAQEKQMRKNNAKLRKQVQASTNINARDRDIQDAAKNSELLAQQAMDVEVKRLKHIEDLKAEQEKQIRLNKARDIQIEEAKQKRLGEEKDKKDRIHRRKKSSMMIKEKVSGVGDRVSTSKISLPSVVKEANYSSAASVSAIHSRKPSQHSKFRLNNYDESNKSEVEQQQKELWKNSLPEDFKYDAYTPAVPLEVIQHNFNKIQQGKLHPKRHGQSVRRQMTEKRISTNIMNYNSAIVMPETANLFIGKIDENEQEAGQFNSSKRSIATQSVELIQNRSQINRKRAVNSSIALSNVKNLISQQGTKMYGLQLAKILQKRSHDRKLISELRQRSTLIPRKNSKYGSSKRGSESLNVLARHKNSSLSTNMVTNSPARESIKAYNSVFVNSSIGTKEVSIDQLSQYEPNIAFANTRSNNEFVVYQSQQDLPLLGDKPLMENTKSTLHHRTGSMGLTKKTNHNIPSVDEIANYQGAASGSIEMVENSDEAFRPKALKVKDYLWQASQNNGNNNQDAIADYSPIKISQSNLYQKTRLVPSVSLISNTEKGTVRQSKEMTSKAQQRGDNLLSNQSEQSLVDNLEPLPIYTNMVSTNNDKVNVVIANEEKKQHANTFSKFQGVGTKRNQQSTETIKTNQTVYQTKESEKNE